MHETLLQPFQACTCCQVASNQYCPLHGLWPYLSIAFDDDPLHPSVYVHTQSTPFTTLALVAGMM